MELPSRGQRPLKQRWVAMPPSCRTADSCIPLCIVLLGGGNLRLHVSVGGGSHLLAFCDGGLHPHVAAFASTLAGAAATQAEETGSLAVTIGLPIVVIDGGLPPSY